jgi:hypothetical protein
MRSPDAGVITHRTGRPSRIGAARLLALARPGARNARWATGNSAVIMIRRSCWRKLPRTRAADACPPPAHAERARCSPCSGRRTCAGRPDSGSPWPLYFTMEARFYWHSSGARSFHSERRAWRLWEIIVTARARRRGPLRPPPDAPLGLVAITKQVAQASRRVLPSSAGRYTCLTSRSIPSMPMLCEMSGRFGRRSPSRC